jgi:hyperosmotically inducible periplasmic protein
MKRQFSNLAVVTIASAVLLFAHSTLGQQNEPRPGQNIIREVRHELLLLPYYSVFDNLAFRVEGSKVILSGQVVRPSRKSDAEAAVKSVEGVSSIQNDIEVLPPAPFDDQLRRALFRAIYSEPSLSRYAESSVPSIHIIVKGGHVTLVGTVENATDKNLAGLRANGVPNVFSVDNELVVEGGGK